MCEAHGPLLGQEVIGVSSKTHNKNTCVRVTEAGSGLCGFCPQMLANRVRKGGARNPGGKVAKALGKRTSILCRDITLENPVQRGASKCPRVPGPAGRENNTDSCQNGIGVSSVDSHSPCTSRGEPAGAHAGIALDEGPGP